MTYQAMTEEDKKRYRGMALELVGAIDERDNAEAARTVAEETLLEAMVARELGAFYYGDYYIELQVPETGDVYLVVKELPRLDPEL